MIGILCYIASDDTVKEYEIIVIVGLRGEMLTVSPQKPAFVYNSASFRKSRVIYGSQERHPS